MGNWTREQEGVYCDCGTITSQINSRLIQEIAMVVEGMDDEDVRADCLMPGGRSTSAKYGQRVLSLGYRSLGTKYPLQRPEQL